jgi:3-keto-L-gulonate-6-phosphate decarboxylase
MSEEIEIQTALDVQNMEKKKRYTELAQENQRLIEENTKLTEEMHKKLDEVLKFLKE